MMIELQAVSKSYGGKPVLQDIDWFVNPGEFWGVIGPNGSGKSTLLHLISGTERPDGGKVLVGGKSVSGYGRKALARLLAMLQQDGLPPVSFPVREVVEMGRFPYLDWLGRDTSKNSDERIAAIMNKLALTPLAEKPLDELSGGQRQRAALGKVMAQEPEILLLDEPTTFLDIHYQVQFMELISAWRQETGLTLVAVIHDLNLAALYCDKLLVLDEGRIAGFGTAEEILTSKLLHEVFQVEPLIIAHPDTGTPQILLKPESVRKPVRRTDAYGRTGG